jgi:hypothetical protein
MNEERPPILVDDTREVWVVYDGDAVYDLVAALPHGENGTRQASPEMLAKVAGWWWDTAEKRVQAFLAALEIPWEELGLNEKEAREAEAGVLVEKLARVSYYITKASREMAGLAAKLSLARDAMEHAVSRLIALRDDKGTIAAKTALLISKDKRLRNTKIEVMEAEAAKRALEHTLEALDVNWRTVSRALSVRLHEPTE